MAEVVIASAYVGDVHHLSCTIHCTSMSVDYDIEEEVLEAEEDVETPGREEERTLPLAFTLTGSGTEEIGH